MTPVMYTDYSGMSPEFWSNLKDWFMGTGIFVGAMGTDLAPVDIVVGAIRYGALAATIMTVVYACVYAGTTYKVRGIRENFATVNMSLNVSHELNLLAIDNEARQEVERQRTKATTIWNGFVAFGKAMLNFTQVGFAARSSLEYGYISPNTTQYDIELLAEAYTNQINITQYVEFDYEAYYIERYNYWNGR